MPLKKIMNHSDNRIRLLCFFLLFFNCILLSTFLSTENFAYDSKYYWTIADPVVYQYGKISLLAFPETFRGCVLPLIVLALKVVFRGIWGWRVFSALMVAGLFGIFLPKIAGFSITTAKDTLRVITAELVLLYFWGDFLQYPLSDMPAVFFLAAGIYFLDLTLNLINENVGEKRGSIYTKAAASAAAGGACLYAAYNCRAVFLYSAILVAAVFIGRGIKRRRTKSLLIVGLGLLFGLGIAACPQCLINKEHIGVYSPKVYTEQYTDYKKSLQAEQVLWGLSVSRYETYIGNAEQYPTPGVFFDDPIGRKIVEMDGIEAENFSVSDIVVLFSKHPLDILGIYTRHLISLMTPAWNQSYITNLFADKTFVVLFSIALWYLAGLNVLSQLNVKVYRGNNVPYKAAFCVPAFMQLFGAPEIRFFLPIFLLLYTYVFYEINYRKMMIYVKSRWPAILIFGALLFALWITVLGDTLSFNREATLLIGDSIKNIK